ncbi:MAG TPA: ABC transporter permease, partial [Mycobacterium sp.]|nr:ABC transporter permease [Mycobacterium sp.]
MTALAVLNAERIKLGTTRAPLWIALTVAALSLVLAAVQGSVAHGAAPLEPERAATGVAVFGVPVLMVLASMTVTTEYRSGMIRTTFMATPDRTVVLLAKAFVAALFSAVCAAVMVVGSVLVARLFTTPPIAAHLSLTVPEVWRAPHTARWHPPRARPLA